MSATEPLLDDIRRQPAVLRDLLARIGEVEAFAARHLRPGPGGALHVVGCGDGWFAARAAAVAFQRCGFPYRPAGALPFLLEEVEGLGREDRVLAISMSGNVDRTVAAATATRDRSVPLAVLTNRDGGRLGAVGGARFSLGIDDLAPFLPGTSSYGATLLFLLLAAGAPEIRPGVEELAAELSAIVADAERVLAPLAAETAPDLGGVRILTVGGLLATADYGAAKLVELTRHRPWTDDVEEFAHRQFWSADPKELIVFLAADAAVGGAASASADALGEMGFRTLAIEAENAPVPAARWRVRLPVVPPAVSGLALAPPLQVLAYHLALASGLDPNRRRHLKDDALRFRVSRMLTRRSLLGTGA